MHYVNPSDTSAAPDWACHLSLALTNPYAAARSLHSLLRRRDSFEGIT